MEVKEEYKAGDVSKRIAELEAELEKRDATIAQLNDALVKFVNAVNIIGSAVALCPRMQAGR